MFLDWKNQYCENDYTTQSNHRFSALPIQLPMTFFTGLEQKILKFVWRHKRPQIAKAVLREKSVVGGIRLPDFRLYHKATVIKTVWDGNKNRHLDQWNRIESPELKPLNIQSTNIPEESKEHPGGKESLFNNWCWENWINTFRTIKLYPYVIPHGSSIKIY